MYMSSSIKNKESKLKGGSIVSKKGPIGSLEAIRENKDVKHNLLESIHLKNKNKVEISIDRVTSIFVDPNLLLIKSKEEIIDSYLLKLETSRNKSKANYG